MNNILPDKFESIIKESQILNGIFKQLNICNKHCGSFITNENCYNNCLNKINKSIILSNEFIKILYKNN